MLPVLLALWAVLAEDPFEGFSRPLAIAAGALALYAVWTLLSAIWSDSSAGALIEFDRALLYLSALVLFGSLGKDARRDPSGWCGAWRSASWWSAWSALITRVLPDVWPIAPNLADNRLSYPLTYWNALGLLSALGIIFCLHLTCSLQRAARRCACSRRRRSQLLAATLLFTFSRGAIAAAIVGVVAYVVVARPRGLLSGLLAAGPPTAVALVGAYDADLLATTNPTTPAAAAQGHDVARGRGLRRVRDRRCRALLLLLDARLERRAAAAHTASAGAGRRRRGDARGRRRDRARRRLSARAASADQYDRFVHTAAVGDSTDRLPHPAHRPGNNGRIDQWDVAIDAFDGAQARRHRRRHLSALLGTAPPDAEHRHDAHSLYAEVLGELGVVGSLLLVVGARDILVGDRVRAKGRNRTALRGAVRGRACLGGPRRHRLGLGDAGGHAVAVRRRGRRAGRLPTGRRPRAAPAALPYAVRSAGLVALRSCRAGAPV